MNPAYLLLFAAIASGGGVVLSWFSARAWLGCLVLSVLGFAGASLRVLSGGSAWVWRGGFSVGGEGLHLRLDGISALFLLLLSLVGGTAALYAHDYWLEARHPRSARWGRFWWSLMMVSIAWVFLSSNGLHFLIAWELFAVSAYFLITLDRHREEVRQAGWLYLGASHAGTLCLFAFFTLLAVRTGSWDLGPFFGHAGLAPLFWLALAGFGLKAGLFPLHIWLPSAHSSAPSHVSAIMSGVAIKLGIYGLVRFSGWLPMPDGAGWTIVVLGMASAVLGVVFALGQHDLKRLLAYHSVENIGIILIGLGFAIVACGRGEPAWGRLVFAGALLHTLNHGLFKALLFLGAGSILHATRTREMSLLGGLWRPMPWTAAFFGLGAAAIAGLPPLNGFVSEWLILLGLFDAVRVQHPPEWLAIAAAVSLGMTGALALACFSKVCGVVFLGAPRSACAAHAHEAGVFMRSAMFILAGLCVLIGLAPTLVWPALAVVFAVWAPNQAGGAVPEALVTLGFAHCALALLMLAAGLWLWTITARRELRRELTWDCGYARPTARMQYTAGSFARTITDWFDWILCPVVHEHRADEDFPADASRESHTPETVLEHVVTPVGRGVLFVSTLTRRLQHGRAQSYIFYLLLGLFALAALAAAGGRL